MSEDEKALVERLRQASKALLTHYKVGAIERIPADTMSEAADAIERIARERDEVIARLEREEQAIDLLEKQFAITARQLSEARAEIERLRGALKPFADRVYYDNGSVGVGDTYLVTSEQFIEAFFAYDRATRAALATATPPAQDMVLVPREPTEAMKIAAFGPIMHGGRGGPLTIDRLNQEAALSVYRKMIAAHEQEKR
jgi:hypothetical protein